MQRILFLLLSSFTLVQITPLFATESAHSSSSSFSPFTGKITRNKVRMRLQPSLDSAVLRELNKDDLLVVASETEDFYGIYAPKDIKAYVYRTFILDNVVEGNHVNIRLEPTLDAPVITQLNAGDRVEGTISPINSKWLEITPPKTTEFYVAKDFVEKIGDKELFETIHKKREMTNQLLTSTYNISSSELDKPYQDIHLNTVFQNLDQIIHDKNSSSEQIEKAKSMLTLVQDRYLKRKIAFLEEKPETLIQKNENSFDPQINQVNDSNHQKIAAMNVWVPCEEKIYQNWAADQQYPSYTDFYEQQKENAIILTGVIESFDRSIKNKPGDFVLVNSNRVPIAYLYSTKINLQPLNGQEVSLSVVERPNNSFAFPAYFVLSIN